jgi:hypothetical protein
MRINQISVNDYAIVERKNYDRYGNNCFVFRLLDNLDEARYQCDSLCRCDGINYAIVSGKTKKLVY